MSLKLINIVKKYPFFIALLIILGVIIATTLKPSYYFLGWDNYSSYFNLKTNLFRTFFATWRDYRGLGVPSDSENTDFIRQIFFFIISLFIKTELLDQIYYVFCLFTGVVIMYIFSYKLIKKSFIHHTERFYDFFAFISAFFYLFNLNTLSIYYFPILPYITRFVAIPFTFLIFLKYLNKSKINIIHVCIFILGTIFVATSYVTATVFITMMMALTVFLVFQGNFKRSGIIFSIFILLNLFWLLPFANYTVQKSSLIRKAPTFIEANESQLNKPKSFYKVFNQLVLYPNFFDTTIKDLSGKNLVYFHPLVNELKTPLHQFIAFIFPALYLVGSVIIILNFKHLRKLIWIPIIILSFLFLSLKEYSFLGFLYSFLNNITPYFGVLFRFGDTKFHPFIAFAGSISSSIALLWIYSYVKHAHHAKQLLQRVVQLIILIPIVLTLFLYKTYFTGDLIGFFMYNKIPQAYFSLAQDINTLPEGRVLHLPYERNAYWKSYSWGLLGSSFLNYLIDKPLIDKTFEPASMENAYLHEKIFDEINNIQSSPESIPLTYKVKNFYELLQKTGIKYIVFDSTVTAEQQTRGTTLWGKFNLEEAKTMMNYLEKNNMIVRSKNYEVDLKQYESSYKKVFPLTTEQAKLLQSTPKQSIVLYEVLNVKDMISFESSATNIDSTLDTVLASDISETTSIEFPKKDKILFPFKNKKEIIQSQNNQNDITFSTNSPNIQLQTNEDPNTQPSQSFLVDITARTEAENLILRFYHQYLPTLQNIERKELIKEMVIPLNKIDIVQSTSKEKYRSNWHILKANNFISLRLSVDNVVIPLPVGIDTQEKSIGSVVVHNNVSDIKLLQFQSKKFISPSEISLTEKPNCFDDKLEGYEANISKNQNELKVQGKNGSVCFWRDLKDVIATDSAYFEVNMKLNAEQKDLDSQFNLDFNNTSKPALKKYITSLSKPNNLRVCIKQYDVDDCYNSHSMINLRSANDLIVPSDSLILNPNNLLLFFSLKNTSYQQQAITLKEISFDLYKIQQSDQLSIDPPQKIINSFKLDNYQKIKLSFPNALSKYSFYYNKDFDGFYLSNRTCQENKAYRTYRLSDDGAVISYVENCQNQLFQQLPFASDNFYLWRVNYNLASGKYPQFSINDGFFDYKQEYLSLYQGYPDIDGFKVFQDPELMTTPDMLKKKFNQLKFVTATTFINANPTYYDTKRKDIRLFQHSENEGIMALNNFEFIELPTSWQSLKVIDGNPQQNYPVAQIQSVSKILPSLYKVSLKDALKKENYLVRLNSAYDQQWGIYNSLSEVFLGKSREVVQARCDGFANCFVINGSNITQKTFYIFFWPERLNILGWMTTFVTILILIIWTARSVVHEGKHVSVD